MQQKVECTNCDGSEVGIVLAGVAALLAAGSLITAIYQAKLASKQTALTSAQAKAAERQTTLAEKQTEIAEKEHQAFVAEAERRPHLTASVRLQGEFPDGNVRKPTAERRHSRLEVVVDNGGGRGADDVVVNVIAPSSLQYLRWAYGQGQEIPDAEPPAPVPVGTPPIDAVTGDRGQYLTRTLDVPPRSYEFAWANFLIGPGVTTIPFRITMNHESLAEIWAQDFVVNVEFEDESR